MFRLSETAIDIAALRARLARADAGACVTFEGWVRDHNDGKAVRGLAYQSYAELAEREGGRIMEEARERFAVAEALCVHRVGELAIGELAVWVGVSAGHRDAAFAACRYIIDEVKRRVPIWKNERYADGASGWLHPDNTPVA
ncbi:MAG TPA: molybdenum cofactor biosynthesis protein MoaE [Mizugakiibacter sp.]